MFFIDAARRLFGSISVETIPATRKTAARIRISGIRGDLLARDLQFYFKTSRVAKYMFERIGTSYVIFPAFFALEVLSIMDMIINTRRPNYVSRRTASTVRDALLEGTWLKDTVEANYNARLDLSKLKLFKYTPLPYQQVWLEKFDEICFRYKLNGAVLDAIMGSGKTMMGLYVAECSNADNIIIISPKNAMDQVWIKTINNDLNYQPTLWRSDQRNPYRNERYIICHYEAMAELPKIIEGLRKKNKTFAIVVDESHNFNEINTARARVLIDVCQASESEFIILQSGTPFKAVGAEIVTALYCIDPTFNDDLAARFKALYAASATEALELLKRRLGLISYKVLKEQVGLGKPIMENVKVSSPDGNKFTMEAVANEMAQFVKERVSYYNARKADDERLYKQILQDFEERVVRSSQERVNYKAYLADVAFVRRGDLKAAKDALTRTNTYERNIIMPALDKEEAKLFKEVKTIYKYVILKIQGECLGRVLGRRRMECSVEIAKNFDYDTYIQLSQKKSLVYTVYVEAVKTAQERLMDLGYNTKIVYGDTNKEIDAIVTEFDTNPELNPLVATFKSLSTAIPLTMANQAILLDTPFRSHILQQTIARIERLGQKEQTYVFTASLDTGSLPNLSTRTIDILRWSQTQIERITGVEPPFMVEEKALGLESFFMQGKPLPDSAFVEWALESAYMRNIE